MFPLLVASLAVATLHASASHAERLVWSVTSQKLVDASRPGKPVYRRSTSISVWDPATRAAAHAFSDDGLDIVLLVRFGGGLYQERVIVPAESSLFALATERRKGESEYGINAAGSIYELSLDGSNRARRIALVESEIPLWQVAVSADGGKLAYVGYSRSDRLAEQWLVVLDRMGTRLAKTRLRPFLDDCRVNWMGWSADGKTLRWVIDADGDEHTATEAGRAKAGNYVTRWDGTAPVRQRAGFGFEIGPAIVGYPPDSTQHEWVAYSPSRRFFTWSRDAHPRPVTVDTREVWVRDESTHGTSKVVSVPPAGGNLSLLGWLRH